MDAGWDKCGTGAVYKSCRAALNRNLLDTQAALSPTAWDREDEPDRDWSCQYNTAPPRDVRRACSQTDSARHGACARAHAPLCHDGAGRRFRRSGGKRNGWRTGSTGIRGSRSPSWRFLPGRTLGSMKGVSLSTNTDTRAHVDALRGRAGPTLFWQLHAGWCQYSRVLSSHWTIQRRSIADTAAMSERECAATKSLSASRQSKNKAEPCCASLCQGAGVGTGRRRCGVRAVWRFADYWVRPKQFDASSPVQKRRVELVRPGAERCNRGHLSRSA